MTDERWPIIVKDRWPEPNDYVQPLPEYDTLLQRAAVLGLHLRNLVAAIDELDALGGDPGAPEHVAALVDEAKVILGWTTQRDSSPHRDDTREHSKSVVFGSKGAGSS